MARYFPDRRRLGRPFSQSPALSGRGGFGAARPRTPMFSRSPALRGGFSSIGERGIGGQIGASRVRPAPSPLIGSIKNISQSVGGLDDTTPKTTVINRLVTARMQNLVPRISNKVEQHLNTFDPGALLNKVFSGGVRELEQLAQAIQSIITPLNRVFDFVTEASKTFTKLIKKLLKGGQGGSPAFGLKNLLSLAMPMMAVASTYMATEAMKKARAEEPIDQSVPVDQLRPSGGQKSTVQPMQEGTTKDIPGQLTVEELDVFNKSIKKFNKLLDALLKQKEEGELGDDKKGASAVSVAQPVTAMAGSKTPGGGDLNMEKQDIKTKKFGIPDSVALLKGLGATDDEAVKLSANMKYESGGDPNIDTVKSGLDPNKENEYSIGLYQINWKAHKDGPIAKKLGITNPDQLRNPAVNARFAIELYRTQGVSAWSANSKVQPEDIEEAQRSLRGSFERFEQMGGKTKVKPPVAPGSEIESPVIDPDQSSIASAESVEGLGALAEQIAKDPTSMEGETYAYTDPQGNVTVIPVPSGQQRPPNIQEGPKAAGVQVPFILAMKEDIHIMHSKIVYNVVDAS